MGGDDRPPSTDVSSSTLVSASNAGALFDLRCDVREGMVQWLQRTSPGALPRRRLEYQTETGDRRVQQNGAYRGQRQADSGLFSGSAEAERRSREFDDEREHDARRNGELAQVRYDG